MQNTIFFVILVRMIEDNSDQILNSLYQFIHTFAYEFVPRSLYLLGQINDIIINDK